MQSLFVLSLALAVFVTAAPVDEPNALPRFFEFPDGDGNMHTVDTEEPIDHELLTEIARNPANNRYFLYTRRTPHDSQELVYRQAESIWQSHFNPRNPTVVIVHGWLSNQDTNLNPTLRHAFLTKSDVNVIVMDWRRLAISGYLTAARGVPAVGRGLGQFLEWLQQNTGLQWNQVHLAGFSLGAHVVGNAGRQLRGQVARITGLDPAGPMWNYNSDRLSASDAKYVEAIHTNGGIAGLGIGTSIAHADFYPNGGNTQPGCLTPICDHNRAWELFAASVTYNHLIGNECTSNLQITMNRCRGREFPLGNDDLNKFGNGDFRVNTARRHPF